MLQLKILLPIERKWVLNIHELTHVFQAENVAKVVPNRIFSMAVHPTTNKLLVAAGGKWGNVGIWDVNDKASVNHGVQLFKVKNYRHYLDSFALNQ